MVLVICICKWIFVRRHNWDDIGLLGLFSALWVISLVILSRLATSSSQSSYLSFQSFGFHDNTVHFFSKIFSLDYIFADLFFNLLYRALHFIHVLLKHLLLLSARFNLMFEIVLFYLELVKVFFDTAVGFFHCVNLMLVNRCLLFVVIFYFLNSLLILLLLSKSGCESKITRWNFIQHTHYWILDEEFAVTKLANGTSFNFVSATFISSLSTVLFLLELPCFSQT